MGKYENRHKKTQNNSQANTNASLRAEYVRLSVLSGAKKTRSGIRDEINCKHRRGTIIKHRFNFSQTNRYW